MNSSERDIAVILPAAGSGRRFGRDENKLFARLGELAIWEVAARALAGHPRVARLIMPVSPADREKFESVFADSIHKLSIELTDGGAERTDSVGSGLETVGDDVSIQMVAVHDAARPLVSRSELDAVFSRAEETGAAVLALPATATVKQTLDSGRSCHTLDRETIWLAQTPQVFHLTTLREAYAKHRGRPATDDADLVQRIGVDVALVVGSPENLKITHPDDLSIAEAILERRERKANG